MTRILIVALAMGALVAGRDASPVVAADAAPASVADASLGLVKGSVFDVPTPPPLADNATAPGEVPVLPRPYSMAPPRTPHGTADFLPITPKENACLDCHGVTEKKAGEPTPIPGTHYVDMRHAPGQVNGRLSGARYVCVACHAGRTDAPDLMENRFRP
jgi:cytochrome c-type protein NapB